MRYMLLIYQKEADRAATATPETHRAWYKYSEDLKSAVKVLASDGLKPVSTATTVREKGGKVITADGPFAETKEQLGGFYCIEAKDLDEALAWAGKAPHIPRGGSVEVRPVMEMP